MTRAIMPMPFQLLSRLTMTRSSFFSTSCVPLIYAISITTLTCPAYASEQRLACPPQLPVETISFPSAVDDGWTRHVPSPLELTSAGFMQASPEKMAHLKPFSSIARKNKLLVTWKFEGDYPQGKWLSCDYAGGVLSLSKEIQAELSECVLSYEKNSQGKVRDIQIDCK